LAVYVAQKTGLSITPDQQAQITVLATSLLSGAIAGIVNFIKHRNK
jgi:hypothetical protein